MSVFCFKDGMLAVDGLEVNARAKSINVSYGAEPLDVTVFGSETGKAHVNMSGLFEWGIEAEGFLNPTATLASDIDAQLYRMIGQRNRSARVPPAVPLFESSFADDPAVPLWLIDVGFSLIGWWRGDDLTGGDGADITTWPSAGSVGSALTGGAGVTATKQTNVRNALAVARFDGVDQEMAYGGSLSTLMGAGLHCTIFVAFKADSTLVGPNRILSSGTTSDRPGLGYSAAEAPTWITYDGSARTIASIYTSGAKDQWMVWCADHGSNSGSGADGISRLWTGHGNTFRDADAESVACGDLTFGTGMVVGANAASGSFFKGDIGEIIIFQRQLTERERVQVAHYLAWRWGARCEPKPGPVPVAVGAATTEAGVALISQGEIESTEFFGSVGEAAPFSLSLVPGWSNGIPNLGVPGHGPVLVRGKVAFAPTARTGAGSYNGTALLLGATAATTAVLLQVHLYSFTGDHVYVDVESSPDGVGSWTSRLSNGLTGAYGTHMGTAPAVIFQARPGAITDTYWRVVVNVRGGTAVRLLAVLAVA